MSSDSTGEAPVQSEVYPGPAKGLLTLVKVLGVILVLLFLALIGGIIWKATHKSAPVPTTDVMMDLGIDPSAIRHLQLDGNTLAISTDTDLVVLDVKLRKVILRSKKP
jgi:hypothetical protein